MDIKFTVTEKELIEYKKRRRVRSLVTAAINRGELTRPVVCELCKQCNGRIEAHHSDYGKPLDVVWLCIPCHKKAHQSDSPMNPKNVPQTPMPDIVDKYKRVCITFEVPVENFIALKREADRQNKTMTEILREKTLTSYPVETNQLEFTFKEKANDDPQHVQHERISGMEESQELLLQSESPVLQKVRSKRNLNLQGMERKLPAIPFGHGANAGRLHRACANR